MKKTLLALMIGSLSLTLAGCSSTTVGYGDAQEIETTTVDFGSTDLQTIASEMVDDLLRSPAVSDITRNGRPIVFVEQLTNKTTEHIDTESITDSISTRMLRSGKFRFVDMKRVEAVRDQVNFQNNDPLVNPNSAIQFGSMVGAEYMLYGNISSIVKTNKKEKDVYYKVTMSLMDIKTGIVEWMSESEIRKKEVKSTFGL